MKLESQLIKSFSNEQLKLYHSIMKKKELVEYLLLVVAMVGGIVVGYIGAN